jgi:hypothetical protein
LIREAAISRVLAQKRAEFASPFFAVGASSASAGEWEFLHRARSSAARRMISFDGAGLRGFLRDPQIAAGGLDAPLVEALKH